MPTAMQTEAIRIHAHGGPEVLRAETVALPAPGPGQARVRVAAAGVQYADVYEREGDHGGPHDAAPFPIAMGRAGAGVVEALGPMAEGAPSGLRPGARVGWIGPGAYAGHALAPAARLVALPEAVSFDVAAAWLLRGLTAEYLLRRLRPVGPGDTVLVHAAAGGMGLLLGQWGAMLGARMIGTVGGAGKIAAAKAHGYDAVIDYSAGDFAPQVMDLTGGRGADVILDGVGRAAFLPSLACVRPRGMVVSYGTASGNVGAFDLQLLHSKSIVVTRPTLRSWIADPAELAAGAAAFFAALETGRIATPIGARLPLREAAEAHRLLESRTLTAPVVLVPAGA